MKPAQLDRLIRSSHRHNQEQKQPREPRPYVRREVSVEDRALRELTNVLRGKLQRRCAPFTRPRPRSSFRLVP